MISALPDKPREFIKASQILCSELEIEKKIISNKGMVNKIIECQELINEICKEIELYPETSEKLDKFINYYYPMIRKMVKKYSIYEHRSKDENNVKNEIYSAMEEINKALANVVERIKSFDDLDVLCDISVMKQMIDRDGLKSGLK